LRFCARSCRSECRLIPPFPFWDPPNPPVCSRNFLFCGWLFCIVPAASFPLVQLFPWGKRPLVFPRRELFSPLNHQMLAVALSFDVSPCGGCLHPFSSGFIFFSAHLRLCTSYFVFLVFLNDITPPQLATSPPSVPLAPRPCLPAPMCYRIDPLPTPTLAPFLRLIPDACGFFFYLLPRTDSSGHIPRDTPPPTVP